MEDVDGGLHPAVDGQSLDEDEDEDDDNKNKNTNNDDDHDNNFNRIQKRNSRFVIISSLRREPSLARTLKWPGRSRVQITRSTSSAYHVQHVVLCATWYEGTAQP